ncbi:MAG TPA: glycosyltransferase family 4 protein [Pyrinomonadaceae bacterium]|nr:glycosyltransferase family 4 protein [Pyrinomonadaceae bacterium]
MNGLTISTLPDPSLPSFSPNKRRIRALHAHAGNLFGGVESMLLTLVREHALCPELENDFALCFAGRFSHDLLAAGATLHQLNPVRIRQPLSVRRARTGFRKILEKQSFDAVITHSSWSHAIFGPVARSLRLPLLFYMHAPMDGQYWLERLARRTKPDAVVCNSEFTASGSRKMYPTIHQQVVYCAVAAPGERLSSNETGEVRAEFETAADATVIIQVSRMEALKGHSLLLEAVHDLKDLKKITVWIVGAPQTASETAYFQSLKARTKELGLAERVRFLGERSDVPRLLASADIYCQPNIESDSFGISFIEALYARLPVVTSSIGGAKEIVDESCGILVPARDRTALVAALRKLIENPQQARELGRHGASRAAQLCDPTLRLREFYQALVDAAALQVNHA